MLAWLHWWVCAFFRLSEPIWSCSFKHLRHASRYVDLFTRCCCLLQALQALPEDAAARVVGACPRSSDVRLKVLPQHLHHLVATIPAWEEVCSHAQRGQSVGPDLSLAAVQFQLCIGCRSRPSGACACNQL